MKPAYIEAHLLASNPEATVSNHDHRTPRLFVDDALAPGLEIALDRDQSHYLLNVLRLGENDVILMFNGRDGEWLAPLSRHTKKAAVLTPQRQTRTQPPPSGIDYYFAPLKHARLDYLVQKAVEMGAGRICPVITQHTQVSRRNADRIRANMIEAAEQCGILAMPELLPETSLENLLGTWSADLPLVFCDERAEIGNPAAALNQLGTKHVALLIGPEGGFSTMERERLLTLPSVIRLSLGPRTLRADTAAVAALAILQTFCGDWRPS